MPKLPYVKFNAADWRADPNLAILRNQKDYESIGIYFEIIMLMWSQGNQYELDMDVLSPRLALGLHHKKWSRVWPSIAHMFVIDGSRIIHKRLKAEVEHQAQVSDMRRQAAEKRWGKKDASAVHCANKPSSESESDTESKSEPEKKHIYDRDIQPLIDRYRMEVVSKGKPGEAKKRIRTRLKGGVTTEDLNQAITNCSEYHRQAETDDQFRQGVEVFFNQGWQDLRWWPEVQTPKKRAGPDSAQRDKDWADWAKKKEQQP